MPAVGRARLAAMPRGRCPDTGFAKPNDLSVLNAPCCWLIFSCMFDPDAAFYTLSYATVTGVVLVVLVLGVIWASR